MFFFIIYSAISICITIVYIYLFGLNAVCHIHTYTRIHTHLHIHTNIYLYKIHSQPSARQYENAVQVVSQGHRGSPVQALRALQGINIPVFRAQGLSLTRANREVDILYVLYILYCIKCNVGGDYMLYILY